MSLSVISSYDLAFGLLEASHGSESLLSDKLALSSISDKVLKNSKLLAPAHGSLLLASLSLVDGAVLLALLESPDDCRSSPVTLPLALGPLSESLGEGLASLALSHENSDDSSSGCLSQDASGELSGTSLVLSARLLSSSPSSEHFCTSDDESSDGLAPSEGPGSSLEGGASLSVLGEGLLGSGDGADASASGHSLVSVLDYSALGALFVREFLHDLQASWGAHLSHGLSRLPDDAVVVL